MEQEELIIEEVKIETEVKLENECFEQEPDMVDQGDQSSQTDNKYTVSITPADDLESESENEDKEEPEVSRAERDAARKRRKNYFCSVLGCKNKRTMDDPPEQRLTMFSLPTDPNRRKQWLRMIDREELRDSAGHHQVCEAHFYPGSIMVTTSRKILKKTALPILNLPSTGGKHLDFSDESTQVWVYVSHKHSQADPATESRHTQTTMDLLQHLPTVVKLKQRVKELTNDKRKLISKKNEVKLLHALCDKYMSNTFATFTKLHLRNKEASRGNRYTDDFKRFCLRLYEASPAAYKILNEVLPLPSTTIIHTIKRAGFAKEDEAPMQEELSDSDSSDNEEDHEDSINDLTMEEAGPSCLAPAEAAVSASETAPMEVLVDQHTQTHQTSAYVQLMSQPMPDLNFQID